MNFCARNLYFLLFFFCQGFSILIVSLTFFSQFMHPYNSHRYANWGSEMENGQQPVSQQARIMEYEEQMPRWQYRLEWRQLLHPKWRFLFLILWGRFCKPVISHLTTSAVLCLISLAFGCIHQYSSVSAYTIKLHWAITQIWASASWNSSSLFHTSRCCLTVHTCFLCLLYSSLYSMSFILTSRPRSGRFSIKKSDAVTCFIAILGSHLYLPRKLQRSMNFFKMRIIPSSCLLALLTPNIISVFHNLPVGGVPLCSLFP